MNAGSDGADDPETGGPSREGWPQGRTVLSDRQRHVLEHLRSIDRPVRLDELAIAVATKEGIDADDPSDEVYEELVATNLPPLVAADRCSFSARTGLVELVDSDEGASSGTTYEVPAGIGTVAAVLVTFVASRWIEVVSPVGALTFVATLAVVAGIAYRLRRERAPDPTGSIPSVERPPTADPSVDSRDAILETILEAGGRMKQSDVVDATGLSKSAVSRHLSALEEDGLVGKFNTGRENVVYLDGMRPRADPDG